MKRGMVLCAALFFLVGCSNDNQFAIDNRALDSIRVTFRGDEYSLGRKEKTLIKEIPNGTYSYNVTYSVPSGITKSTAEEGTSGHLTFQYGRTRWYIIYASVSSDSSYTLNANVTSSDPSSE